MWKMTGFSYQILKEDIDIMKPLDVDKLSQGSSFKEVNASQFSSLSPKSQVYYWNEHSQTA